MSSLAASGVRVCTYREMETGIARWQSDYLPVIILSPFNSSFCVDGHTYISFDILGRPFSCLIFT